VIYNRHNSSINLLKRWTNGRSTFDAQSVHGTVGRRRQDPPAIIDNSVVNYDIVDNPVTGYALPMILLPTKVNQIYMIVVCFNKYINICYILKKFP
jgi:hypothetical protein